MISYNDYMELRVKVVSMIMVLAVFLLPSHARGAASNVMESTDISDYISFNTPPSPEANIANSTSPFGSLGMGVISFRLSTEFKPAEGARNISLMYQETLSNTPSLLAQVDPSSDKEVRFIGMGMLDDDEPGFDPINLIYMFFSVADSGGFNEDEEWPEEADEKFYREGYYTVVIPDGCFVADGKLLSGTSITYHYTPGEVGFDMEYTITPDPSEVILPGDAGDIFGLSGCGISLTIPEAGFVDTLSTPATLTCPDGNVLKVVAPITNMKDTLTWKFPNKGNNWPEGEYEFEIFPGKIYVDMGWAEDIPDMPGNFPGCKVIYHVSDKTGVSLIGGETEAIVHAVTLDGRLIRLNSESGSVAGVEPGVYIVNGKKVVVCK